ncbi:EAL domain-containing protein [Lentilactobacillus sp. SPB1-3]|uniref:EAL domain-containing protein n=1 Tax=Lentilactobacillus terminaliae TaxID=3003483 RepID=A0ACD5DDE4_9LACO|nr:EAL domain-containing protein [Lentilactobacillus sp. SPB1-3]MCZ0977769.1 EAL domain-containing protein [Lentilactobacillus sp. SPB1-3]
MFIKLTDDLITATIIILMFFAAVTIMYIIYSKNYDRQRKSGPHGKLKFFGQPQFDNQGKLLGYELLLREMNESGQWQVPWRPNLLTLKQFLDLMREAVRSIPKGQDVAVNLSKEQLLNPSFEPFIKSVISINPDHQVVIETDLSNLASRREQALLQRIRSARSLGAKLSVDSVGTTMKEYNQLNAFVGSIDYIKCSMDEYRKSTPDQWLDVNLGSWVAFAKQHGIVLVLAKVETGADYGLAKQLGINYVQGYYTGKPMEIEDGVLADE